MKKILVGLDIGNNDVKTVHSTLPSGYEVYKKLPFGTKVYMEYDGKYYISSSKRADYQQDKTASDLCFVLSTMGIAQELIDRILIKYKDSKPSKEFIQSEISKVESICLGVGLPPLDFAVYAAKTKEFYLDKMNHVNYKYNSYNFNFTVSDCKVFAQGLTAALMCKPKSDEYIPVKYSDSEYYIIDIGGYTVDIITVENGVPVISKCYKLSRGIIPMGDEIIAKVQIEFGQEITRQNIESVLQNKSNVVNNEIKKSIMQLVEEWTSSIINECIQKGLRFKSVPTLFVGGGSQLLKQFIDYNNLVAVHGYLSDAKANAMGYEKALRLKNK